jgi:hypothetical protein
MNLRLLGAASITLAIGLGVGCVSNPPSSLVVTSGGDGGSGSGGSTATSTTSTTSSTSGNPATAHDDFVANVYPELSKSPDGMTASCTSCHAKPGNSAPQFLGAAAEASYKLITGYDGGKFVAKPANSILMNHGEHTGPALSAAAAGAVSKWLDMEVAEGGTTSSSSSGGGPVLTDADAMKQFAKCMDITDWTQFGLDQLYNMQSDQGTCQACHKNGTAGNYLSPDTMMTFTKNQATPFIRRMVTSVPDANGNVADIAPTHRWQDKGVEAQTCDDTKENCHPKFLLPQTMVDGIDQFVSKTYMKWKNNQCP